MLRLCNLIYFISANPFLLLLFLFFSYFSPSDSLQLSGEHAFGSIYNKTLGMIPHYTGHVPRKCGFKLQRSVN